LFPETDFSTANSWVSVQKVAINGSRCFAATLSGLYFTDDQFAGVTKPEETYSIPGISESDKLGNATILDIEIGADNTIYASTNRYIFISRDNGATFSEWVGDTKLPRIPATDPSANPPSKLRIEMAVAPSDKKIIYAAEIGGAGLLVGVWKSTDSGQSWEQIGPRSSAFDDQSSTSWNPTRGNGLSNFTLMVDPKDASHLYMGSAEWREYTSEKGWLNVTSLGFEQFPWNPAYMPPGQHIAATMPGDNTVYYIGTDAEIIRAKEKGFTGGLLFGETEFKPATGNYNASLTYGAAPSLYGEIIANTANAGIVVKENSPTLSYRRSGGRSIGSSGSGRVETSKFNPMHSLVAGPYFVLNRSLDGGKSYQSFKESGKGPGYKCLPAELSDPNISSSNATKIPSADGTSYGTTPFVLDEYYNENEPDLEKYINLSSFKLSYKKIPNGKYTSGQANEPEFLTQIRLNEDQTYNPQKPQYAFVCSRDVLWRVTNPFGAQVGFTDTTTGWLAIANKLESQPSSGGVGMPSAITVSGDTSHTVFVGTTDGRVFRFINAHKPCLGDSTPNPRFKKELILNPGTPTAPGEGNARKRWISSLTVKPNDPNTLIVTYGGYDNLGESEDGSESMIYASFNAMDEVPEFYAQDNDPSLPYAPVYSAMYDPEDPDKWLAFGTEFGIFVCDPKSMTKEKNPFTFTEANSGDMMRVPVFQFSHQKYGFATIQEGLSVVFGSETLQVSLADIAQFYEDRINYTKRDSTTDEVFEVFYSKHTNKFSQRMTRDQYSDLKTFDEIYQTLKQFLLPEKNTIQRGAENRLVRKSDYQSNVIKEVITGGLSIKFIKNEGALLPPNVEPLIGNIYASAYGRGVMSSGILASGKTTSRPNEGYDVFIADKNLVSIYPNPTQHKTLVAVKITADSDVKIEVYSPDGRIVHRNNYSGVSTGTAQFEVNLANNPVGVYIIKTTVTAPGIFQSQSVKVVKSVE